MIRHCPIPLLYVALNFFDFSRHVITYRYWLEKNYRLLYISYRWCLSLLGWHFVLKRKFQQKLVIFSFSDPIVGTYFFKEKFVFIKVFMERKFPQKIDCFSASDSVAGPNNDFLWPSKFKTELLLREKRFN